MIEIIEANDATLESLEPGNFFRLPTSSEVLLKLSEHRQSNIAYDLANDTFVEVHPEDKIIQVFGEWYFPTAGEYNEIKVGDMKVGDVFTGSNSTFTVLNRPARQPKHLVALSLRGGWITEVPFSYAARRHDRAVLRIKRL